MRNQHLTRVVGIALALVVAGTGGWAVTRSPHDELASFGSPDRAVVRALAISPDGRIIATAAGDGSVRLWDADSGAAKATFTGHGKGTTAVAFAPDGKTLASGSLDETVKLWNLESGRCLTTLVGFTGPVRAVAFAPDGKTLAVGECKAVRLWAVGSSAGNLRTLTGHKTDVIGVAFLDGGKTLASVGCDKQVRYWDAVTGRAGGKFAFAAGVSGGHLKGFSATADGATAVAALGGRVIVLDLAGRKEGTPIAPMAGVLHGAVITPDGGRVVAASEDRGLVVWNTVTGAEVGALRGHVSFATAVAILPNGLRAVTGGTDGSIKLWDVSE